MNAVVNVREHHRLNFNRLPAMAKQQIDTAQLTPMYEDAKRSLAVLSRVDEVKEMYDKHTAIAHYAKQIKDNSLLYYAERVYARALARIGELIEDLSFKERKEAATHHGLSLSDANHAINMAVLPKKVLEKFVEQTPPMSKSQLSHEGWRIKNANKKTKVINRFTRLPFEVQDNFEECTEREPSGKIAKQIKDLRDYFGIDAFDRCDLENLNDITLMSPNDAALLRKKLRTLIEYLDEMDQRLELREAGK